MAGLAGLAGLTGGLGAGLRAGDVEALAWRAVLAGFEAGLAGLEAGLADLGVGLAAGFPGRRVAAGARFFAARAEGADRLLRAGLRLDEVRALVARRSFAMPGW